MTSMWLIIVALNGALAGIPSKRSPPHLRLKMGAVLELGAMIRSSSQNECRARS